MVKVDAGSNAVISQSQQSAVEKAPSLMQKITSAPSTAAVPSTASVQGVHASTTNRRHSYDNLASKVVQTLTQPGLLQLYEWSADRTYLHFALDSTTYSALMGIVIMMNALLVIHETDLKATATGIPSWVLMSSYTFLGIFALDIVVRLYVYRMGFFQNFWNVTDFLVVVTDCSVEISKVWLPNELPSISILRIFRLVRILRIIAMLPIFNELQTMLLGFGSAMKAMIWASAMIAVVITCCSIIAVEFIHPLNVEVSKRGVYDDDCKRCPHAFETVAQSNLTFISQIIAGDAWGQITLPIIEAYPFSSVFFLTVFGLIDLGVLNLILTVIVNAAESAREANHEVLLRGKARVIEENKKNLKNICENLDENSDGRISLQEFMSGVDGNEDLRTTLALLDIQRQDAATIFNLMDEDGSGDVDFHEFVHTMISTKHDTLNTKLLFLKAGLFQIQRELINQKVVVEKTLSSKDLREAMNQAIEESSAKMGLQWDKIMGECENLRRNLDQRWEQLQVEQAKNCQVLEKVLGEASLPQSITSSFQIRLEKHGIPHLPGKLDEVSLPQSDNGQLLVRPEDQSNNRQSVLSSLAMPPSCKHCRVGDGEKSDIVAVTPEKRIEGGEGTKRVTDWM